MKIIQEHVVLSKEQPFLVSLFENEAVDLSYPFHQHRQAYELTLTSGLSGTRMVGDSTEQFNGNDLVLMSPGLPHCWQDHGVKGNSDAKVLVIQFSHQLIPDTMRQLELYRKIDVALKNARYGLEMTGGAKTEAVDLLSNFSSGATFDHYLLLLQVLQFFGNSSNVRKLCGEGYRPPASADENDRLNQVLQYIQQNYSRKLSIEEVAAQIQLSPSAFSHFFKKRTLKSFTHFVAELRLGKAAQLLQYSDLPVTNVSFECGFQNLSHFNRSFKKKYRLTPLQFRRRIPG